MVESASSGRRVSDGRYYGALLAGIVATLAAVAGLCVLGMTGYVWADGQLWGSSSWSHSAGAGTTVAIVLLGVWAVLVLVAILIALAGARRVEGGERRKLIITAAAVPVISVVLLLLAALIFLGQGGAQLIPLDELI